MSIEIFPQREALPEETVEHVICGVWVANEQRHVPVEHSDTFKDDDFGFTIEEFVDEGGMIRASLLTVSAGGYTPAWSIKQNGETFNYAEIHQIISGSGTIVIKPRQDDYTRSGYSTNSRGDRVFNVREGSHSVEAGQINDIRIAPGETFQVFADVDNPLQILAVFPQKPFKLEYEERVSPLS